MRRRASNGIALSTVRHDRRCDYETLLRVTVANGGTRTIAGTLVGGDKARIVEVQSIAVRSISRTRSSIFAITISRDSSAISAACAGAGINIATFHLGRRGEGGEAIALVEIDQQIGADLMDELRGLAQVVQADLLHFS